MSSNTETTTMKAIRIHQWAGLEALEMSEIPMPHAVAGQIRVKVSAVALNLADVAIATNQAIATQIVGGSLPYGFANDFAGTVDEVGAGVTGFAVGDRVFGSARTRAAAQYIVLTPQTAGSQRTPVSDEVRHTPDGVDDVTASTIPTAGVTADAAIATLGLTAEDTVLIGGAAGGVGVYAVQLARLAGAKVIGTASPATFDFLEKLGATPVAYGEGLVQRVRELAPGGITAAADLHGVEAANTALALGVSGHRISAVAARGHTVPEGIVMTGSMGASFDSPDKVAAFIADGKLNVPIAATFALEDAVEAARAILSRRTHGKIVLKV